MDELSEDIGRLYGKHGQGKVKQFFKKLTNANREIPPASNTKRAMYNFTRASYPADVVVSPSFLRSDVQLAADSSYKFSVLSSDPNTGTTLPITTQRLDQNDTFEMTHLCIMLWTIATTGTIPPAQQSRLYTYPNPSVFAGAGESSALDGLYFGSNLQIEIGTDKVFPKVDSLRFYRVPTAQQGTVLTVNSGGTDSAIAYDGFVKEDYPWMESVPGMTISGNGKFTFTLNLLTAATLSPTAGQNRNNFAALYIRGYLCSNGAKQMNKKFSVTY